MSGMLRQVVTMWRQQWKFVDQTIAAAVAETAVVSIAVVEAADVVAVATAAVAASADH